MIYSAPRLSALSQRIASHVNFSLDYSIQLIFNFRFPIFELVAKKNLFDILLCPFFSLTNFERSTQRNNINFVLFFHYSVIHFS